MTRGEPIRLDIQVVVANLEVVNDPRVTLSLDAGLKNSSSVEPASVLLEMVDGAGRLMISEAVQLNPGEGDGFGDLLHVLDCPVGCEDHYVIEIYTESEHAVNVNWRIELDAVGSPRHGCFSSRKARPSVSLDLSEV